MKKELVKKCPKCTEGTLKRQYLSPNDGWPNGQRFLPGGALTGSRWILICDICDYKKRDN